MRGLSDLLCGCSLTSMERATSTTIGTPYDRQSSTSSWPASGQGLVKACNYEADPDDELDVQVSLQLMTLDPNLASCLLMRRLGPGEYELDGRRVRVIWARPPAQGGTPELLVHEATREGLEAEGVCTEILLLAYLKQVADIAASLGGRSAGAPMVARVPVKERLTFNTGPQGAIDDTGLERLRSMRMACEQARLREHAAEEYDRRERERSASVGRSWSKASASVASTGFGVQRRSDSHLSIGSAAVRVPTPESRSVSHVVTMSAPAGSFAAASMPGASARACSPSLVPTMRLGELSRARSLPPRGPPTRSNSAQVLPSQCRSVPGTASMPLVPVSLVVVPH